MVSAALDEYLAANGNGETVDSLLAKPPIKEPPPFDGSQPLTHYFISSSHNTYLLANQLWGASSPKAYTTALEGLAARAPARCVEIDVWYTKKGPIVTHGHTFTGSIPFKDVCEAIGETVKPDDLPVFISLECHVPPEKQQEIVQIMTDVWEDKLLSKRLDDVEGDKVSPNDLKGRIVMMVEWYPSPGDSAAETMKLNQDDSSSSSDEDSDNSEVKEMEEYKAQHKKDKKKIIESLASLGIYANSIKPKEGWLTREIIHPLHVLINISESALLSLLKRGSSQQLIEHSHAHLRRCYPKGLRVNSVNMDPMPIWRCGTQVAGLNMQNWDKGTYVNGALFRDTQGLVLKPDSLRGGSKRTGRATLKLTIIGGDDIPGAENQAIYVSAKLYTHEKSFEWKTKSVKKHGGDPMFDQSVEWQYQDDDLIFLKVELKEDEWGKDDELASYCLLVDRIEEGLRFWPLFDHTGSPSIGRLLVNVEHRVE
ncbi:PLC-like phosphodiesterase [Serendipita vermifera]|nr:PLC-like phosphodiesterase [Serendipita vermifera]